MSNIIDIKKQYSSSSRNCEVNVNCLYETGKLPNGEPCVVLKTYNPDSKKKRISQTLHINKKIAKQLIEIFKQELNI